MRDSLTAAVLAASIIGLGQGVAHAQGWPAPPVPSLHWAPCAEAVQKGFDCATATVPLDYSRPAARTIQLALIRHRASDPAHRIGTLFFNPGGPGGRGTIVLPLYLNHEAGPTPAMFPRPVRERFDIVSWDPRGVGESTSVQCFPSKEGEDKAIAKLGFGVPDTPEQQQTWIKGWADIAQQCASGTRSYLLPHVSTTETARDLDLLRQAVGDQQLTYQGNSYGTLLGAYYANLFPDKVRAMVLLGNDEPADYTNQGQDNADRTTAIRQGVDLGTADTLKSFLDLCGQASPRQCAFSAGSPAATEAKWRGLMDRLRADPVKAGDVTYSYDLVVTLTVVSLYEVSPGFLGYDWGWLARLLQALWEHSPDPRAYPAFPQAEGFQQATQLLAVTCAETPNPRDPTAYFALAYWAAHRSGPVGPYWVWRDEECAAWPATAADRYTGPWNRPTANPILVVNNTHDPATPMSEAVTMTHALGRARLLTIDGYGHADAATPSTCADAYIAAYLIDGKLPPEGAACRQDTTPFGGSQP